MSAFPLRDAARARVDRDRDILFEARALRLDLRGGIGAGFKDAGVSISALGVAAALRKDRFAPVRATIDSLGGSLSEAERIGDVLRNHKGEVSAFVPRRCHSAAVTVLCAAGSRSAAMAARFLLHPAGFHSQHIPSAYLDAKALRALADDAAEATERFIDVVSAGTPGAPPHWVRDQVVGSREITAWQARMVGLIHQISNGGH